MVLLLLAGAAQGEGELPDIRSVEPDLEVPALVAGPPAAGKRVREMVPAWKGTEVHHVLYLPTNWREGRRYPVLVEFAGNGPYRNSFGDVSSGAVEGSKLGFGISAGRDYLWLCLPYLDGKGASMVRQWWGSAPDYDPQPTIDYCRAAVDWVCERYGGDREQVVLCGFSRGAIACNFLGLHDDLIAGLWCAFVPYSHYDGVRTSWPYPGADRDSARKRLERLGNRPQFICGEGTNAEETKTYLAQAGAKGDFTIRGTGFRNHDDAWILRPSPAREELREWLRKVLAK